jgi:crotonobetainyl-CoA:carnitine CoA-transferase CaiB-like acyl-CoA transferase
VRVLDRTIGVGELCGRLLSDLGADVVKLEPAGGSPTRAAPPDGLWWAYRNWGKRGIVDGDFEAGADVVLHSSLERITPHHQPQVVCAMTWFGQTGPYAGRPATDDVVVGMSGWLSQSGNPEKPPLLLPGTIASDAASVMGAWAVLCALRTGQSQVLDVSAFEAVVQIDTWAVANASNGSPRKVRGGPQMYPAVKTLDGTVKVVVLSGKQWAALFEWLGRPEELADPAFGDMLTRIQRRAEINAVLERFLGRLTTREAAEEAQRRGIVITPINGPADLLVDEHLLARGALADVEVAPGVEGRVPSGFFELDGERLGHRFRAPAVGEHQGQVTWSRRDESVAPLDGAPLAGLRVLDFGHGGVGVQCGRIFADHGADVVKVESRGHPDFMRLMGANLTSPSFVSSSRSKRSLGVDLKSAEGVALVKRLVADADVVIENNSAGTMDALGLGWDDLRAVNPRLVMLSSQLLGSTGPRAGWSGYGPSVQAYGGLVHQWAFDDGEGSPGTPSNHPDLLVGHLLGVLGLAILHRGEGGHGELAQAEVVAGLLGDLVLAESRRPGSVRPDGNDDPRGGTWGVFPCVGDEEWVVVCSTTELPELGDWCASSTAEEVAERCRSMGVPAGRMAYPPDLLTDPQLVARGFLAPLDQPDVGPLVLDRQSYLADRMPLPDPFPAPTLGQHTREVARQAGLADDEIDRLLAAAVLEA